MQNDIFSSLGKIKNNKINNSGKARNVTKISNTSRKVGGFIVFLYYLQRKLLLIIII